MAVWFKCLLTVIRKELITVFLCSGKKMLDIFLFAFADRLLHGTENIPVLLQKFENGSRLARQMLFHISGEEEEILVMSRKPPAARSPVHAFIVSGADGID